jgi:sec-independent protein translocase protein TatA
MPLGGLELLILLVIILLFFGAKRVPELARSIGLGARELKKAASEDDDEKQAQELNKVEAHQDREEPPPPQGNREDGSVPEGEKPKAGPSAKA